MPLYVYRCNPCGVEIEEFRSVAAREGGVHLCALKGKQRSGLLERVFTPTQHTSIPGIPNRVNAAWNESSNLPLDVQHADVLST